jgi:hypothetical protein
MTASPGAGLPSTPAAARPPLALDAVRRELRRARPPDPERWLPGRLHEQLPRVALDEALEILLSWRSTPGFDAGAVAWHARLAGHAPSLTLEDAGRALAALQQFGGPSPEPGALALRALCRRYRLDDVASVLDEWLAQRRTYGGYHAGAHPRFRPRPRSSE